MEIPYEIGQRVWQVTMSNNKPELIEHEITMITIKKDNTIKLRLTRVNEKWTHEVYADILNKCDEQYCCYLTDETCAARHYNLLKATEGLLWKNI